MCEVCIGREGDLFELVDPDELVDIFPYGEWLDETTFAVNQHSHCRCLIGRDHDVYW